jgi:mycofactocin precursor
MVLVDTTSEESVEASETPSGPPQESDADELVEAELLVEDVSIDGMCGVY